VLNVFETKTFSSVSAESVINVQNGLNRFHKGIITNRENEKKEKVKHCIPKTETFPFSGTNKIGIEIIDSR